MAPNPRRPTLAALAGAPLLLVALPPLVYYIWICLAYNCERRDHAVCAAKYGADWDAYCRRVPWRIVPGLY